MEEAFSPGYDPVLELVTHSTKMQRLAEQKNKERGDSEPWTQHLRRKDQDIIDPIVKGVETGRYYVLLSAKVMLNPPPSCRRISSTFTLGHGEKNNAS